MGTVGTYSNSGTDAVCEAALGCECVGAHALPVRVENGQGRRGTPSLSPAAPEPTGTRGRPEVGGGGEKLGNQVPSG